MVLHQDGDIRSVSTTRQQGFTWRRLGVYTALLAAGLLIAVVLVDQFILPVFFASTETIVVPKVTGTHIDDARRQLTELGLQVMEPHEQFSATVREGQVMQQSPYAGATVKEGRRIYLTVSQGTETIGMPSLIGSTVREARLTLMRLGLTLGDISYEQNDSIPEDHIISQSVRMGERVVTNAVVTVAVSRGPSSIRVPDLLGLTLSDAEALLTQFGLVVGPIHTMPSGAFEPNTVMKHDPPADSLVAPGTAIVLTVTR
ncbi:MAG: PASTA domain-containing protein [Ignavibacteriae bacterium]|nr:MAG: PASTA domain-containing protein [Ignavibacteriota bacterium]